VYRKEEKKEEMGCGMMHGVCGMMHGVCVFAVCDVVCVRDVVCA